MPNKRKSKSKVRAELRLDRAPNDDFMQLLSAAGEEDVVGGPAPSASARDYTPPAIEKAVIEGTIGILLARARSESGRSLGDLGAAVGVSRARIQQIEHSENIEVATLVRIAAACGYSVSITLRPVSANRGELCVVLGSVAA